MHIAIICRCNDARIFKTFLKIIARPGFVRVSLRMLEVDCMIREGVGGPVIIVLTLLTVVHQLQLQNMSRRSSELSHTGVSNVIVLAFCRIARLQGKHIIGKRYKYMPNEFQGTVF